LTEVVDLRLLLTDADAAEMLLRARGQLNRAFRTHGLLSPDPLPLADVAGTATAELDDPAANGAELARARYKGAFDSWASEMPLTLVQPVLEILRQTHAALTSQSRAHKDAPLAVMRAYAFLAARIEAERDQRGDA